MTLLDICQKVENLSPKPLVDSRFVPKLSQINLQWIVDCAITSFGKSQGQEKGYLYVLVANPGDCTCAEIDLHTQKFLDEKCKFRGCPESCPMGSLENLIRKLLELFSQMYPAAEENTSNYCCEERSIRD